MSVEDMKIKRILKSALPHIVALVVFAAVSAAMFYPQYDGKALRQGDVVNHEGTDQDVRSHNEQFGEHPHWAGRMFGGMPSYSLSLDQGFRLYDYQWWLHFLGMPASMIFLAMAGFYLMLLLFGVNPYLAIIGGLAYGLSTYLPIIIGAGHITKMWSLQWVPPVIGSIYYAYNSNRWMGGALAALFTAMLVGSNHIQITYYFLFVILALVIGQFFVAYKDRLLMAFVKTSAVLVVAGALGVGSNFVSLYYLSDYSKDSTRGGQSVAGSGVDLQDENKTSGLDRDYINAWSYGKAETFNLFIPNFAGGGADFQQGGQVDQTLSSTYRAAAQYYKSVPSYYGSQPFTEGPVYIGAVVIFLALLGIFLLTGAQKWWILGVVILSILLAWGKNLSWFTDLFIDYVPMYNKFRVPSMILVIAQWGLPLLAVLGLWRLWRVNSGQLSEQAAMPVNKALVWSLSISAGFALFSALILPSVIDFVAPSEISSDQNMAPLYAAMQAERASLLRMDSIRTLLFVLCSAGVVWLFVKKYIKGIVLAALLSVLVVADLFNVDRRYVSPDDFMPSREATAIVMTAADREILSDEGNFRVVDFAAGNPFVSSRASYFHRSVGGYSAAKMIRYQELIDSHLAKSNMRAYDMLNTKYFITKSGVQLNTNAVGNAVVIDSVMWVDSPIDELRSIGDQMFNPARVAIVDRSYQQQLSAVDMLGASDSTDYAVLSDYRVNRLTYDVELSEPRLVMFSEIFHRDWHVTIDGVPATALNVDYVLRGVVVPAGKHSVVWTFVRPHSTATSTVAAVSSSLILLWLLAVVILFFIRRDDKA